MEKIPDTVAKNGETGEKSDEEHAGRLHQRPYHREFVPRTRIRSGPDYQWRPSNEAIEVGHLPERRNGHWVTQRDNAPALTALQTREFLGQTNTIVA